MGIAARTLRIALVLTITALAYFTLSPWAVNRTPTTPTAAQLPAASTAITTTHSTGARTRYADPVPVATAVRSRYDDAPLSLGRTGASFDAPGPSPATVTAAPEPKPLLTLPAKIAGLATLAAILIAMHRRTRTS
ncbi:hypothetical protein A5768_11425 [Mycolicibacterium fortuitum]|uniref:hypothetical protein n=1 Tax=Mycolicibacterium fortuitum TaxID=1766 RepID=UPI0007EBB1CF|nr:hypothetical protein [Mycolicibacterium fortuitum]OBG11822.1 hypothetical protein A5768_11425 [Mycolicibacterium fortuitum]